MVRTIKMSSGIRPMTFDTNPDGSTRNIYVQLSNFHGLAVVDFATGKETRRIEHPAIAGEHAHTDGLQGAPAHGLGVSPDQKTAVVDQQGLQPRLRVLPARPEAARHASSSASTRSG